MFRLDALSIWTRVLVVIDLAVRRRILWRVRMEWLYCSHIVFDVDFLTFEFARLLSTTAHARVAAG